MAVRRLAGLFLVSVACTTNGALAHNSGHGRTPPSQLDLARIAIEESRHLGAPLAPDIPLLAEDGRRFALGELYGKPLLLLLSYYGCEGACPTANRTLAEAIGAVRRFRPGEDFRVLTLSFDAKDDLSALRRFAASLEIPHAARRGWRFALAAERTAIERVTQTVGFRYFWSVEERVFVHPAVLIVISPAGRVARYLPAASIGSRDVELALIEADWNRVTSSGRVLDLLQGVCYSYSFKDGRYVLNLPLFAAAGSLTLGAVLLILSFSVFGRFRKKEQGGA